MRSSTSSSEPATGPASGARNVAGTPLGPMTSMVLRHGGPTVVVAAALVLLAAAAQRKIPSERRSLDLEKVILGAQLERAAHLAPRPPAGRPLDVLVIGDSSALMGVDPVLLATRTGKRVESLATLAWVGPAGHARVLEQAARSLGAAPAELVVLFNHSSLELNEATYAATGYEQRVLEGVREPRRSPLRDLVSDARGGLFDGAIRGVVALPLPGSYGRRYGWPDDLAEALNANHGGLIDPNEYTAPASPKPVALLMTGAFERRLPPLREAIERVHPGRVRFGLTPMAADQVDSQTLATRHRVQGEILKALGLPETALVNLPPSLLASEMATSTHPNAAGRERVTLSLAAALR